MYSKNTILDFLDYLRKSNETNTLVTAEHEKTVSYRRILKIICESKSSEDAYKTIGSKRNVTIDEETEYLPFGDIYYLEDCYDYLIANGLCDNDAEKLTYIIRTGRYGYERNQTLKGKLSPDFFDWAVKTKFLSSRIYFISVFYTEYEEYAFTNKYELPKIGKTLDEAEEIITRYSTTPETLYTEGIVKGKSSMLDEKGNPVVVTDYLAKKLLETKLLDNIPPVEMPIDKNYIVESHNGELTTENESSNRIEEREAIELFNRYRPGHRHPYFFADYQTPICRSTETKIDKNKHLGKIDLIYVSRYEEMIYLTEFKRYDNEESLLRCVTEIYTYYKQVDKLRLAKEVAKRGGLEVISNYKVVPAVLVYEGQLQHMQFRSGLFTNVQKLMQKLGVKFFVVHSDKAYGKKGFFEAKNNFRIYELPVRVMKPIIKYNKSSLREELDKAIMKADTTTEPELSTEYVIGEITFENYLSNDSFRTFIDNMPKNIRDMYGEGAGSELNERKNKYGVIAYPPKMASFGSSSRFIYTLVHEKMKDENFVFELQLPTKVGGTANLDGFMETANSYVFVEAKCREPYGTKTNEFGDKYYKLYKHINKSAKSNLFCKTVEIPDKKKITADFSIKINDDIPIEAIKHFDIKQMISHLLGIGVAILKDGKYLDKPIKFLYLIYDPRVLEFENSEIKDKIVDIYCKACYECESVDYKGLFRVILEFLQNEYHFDTILDIERIVNQFAFEICNQENFIEKLTERN